MASNKKQKAGFELTFWGGLNRRYKKFHETQESAENEARRVLNRLENRGAKPAMIYLGNVQVSTIR